MNDKELKKAERLEAFREWTRDFAALSSENGLTITFIDNGAEILNDIYWTLVENYVRPLVNGKMIDATPTNIFIGRFKIISATELTIVYVQPIQHADEQTERRLNASFAYWVGLNILKTFNVEIKESTFGFIDNYKEKIEGVQADEIQTIQEDHVTWLELLDPQLSAPIISNAQTWRLLNLALLALENKIDFNANA